MKLAFEGQMNRFQLREAAGMFFLLDMEQDGRNYRKPFMLNCVGADIWKMLASGLETEEIIAGLQEEYQVEEATLRADVEAFLTQFEQLLQQEVSL